MAERSLYCRASLPPRSSQLLCMNWRTRCCTGQSVGPPPPKQYVKPKAEAVAFVVGKTIGLQTNRASADYIHLYHGNAALLTESLEVIQKTSAVILSALEKPAAEATEEPETDMAQAS